MDAALRTSTSFRSGASSLVPVGPPAMRTPPSTDRRLLASGMSLSFRNLHFAVGVLGVAV